MYLINPFCDKALSAYCSMRLVIMGRCFGSTTTYRELRAPNRGENKKRYGGFRSVLVRRIQSCT